MTYTHGDFEYIKLVHFMCVGANMTAKPFLLPTQVTIKTALIDLIQHKSEQSYLFHLSN